MNLKFKTYDDLVEFENEKIIKYCVRCKMKTIHRKCGFGNVDSFVGNARHECLRCKK